MCLFRKPGDPTEVELKHSGARRPPRGPRSNLESKRQCGAKETLNTDPDIFQRAKETLIEDSGESLTGRVTL